MRPRQKDRHLPPCVYHRHGAFYLVKRGKWTRLADEYHAALIVYARIVAHDVKTSTKRTTRHTATTTRPKVLSLISAPL